jgi:hypothetical protein
LSKIELKDARRELFSYSWSAIGEWQAAFVMLAWPISIILPPGRTFSAFELPFCFGTSYFWTGELGK